VKKLDLYRIFYHKERKVMYFNLLESKYDFWNPIELEVVQNYIRVPTF